MKTKLLFSFLALFLFALQGWAHEFETDGIKYSTDGDQATVMPLEYPGYSGHIDIPAQVFDQGTQNTYDVTAIGIYAFNHCPNLLSVYIPHSIKTIGDLAFQDCPEIKSITIPSSVENIGIHAFGECYQLTSITVEPGNMSYCSDEGILYDKMMRTLIACPAGKQGDYTIPFTVEIVGNSSFSMSLLNSLLIPASVQLIEENAFHHNRMGYIDVDPQNDYYASEDGVLFNKQKTILMNYPKEKPGEDYIVPNTVTDISLFAFIEAWRITSVYIPASVETIGENAFLGCRSVSQFAVDPQNNYFSSENGVLFDKPKTTLLYFPADKRGNYTVPKSVRTIGNYAFYYSKIRNIVMLDGVETIVYAAFQSCEELVSITIPNSVTNVQGSFLTYCSKLANIYLLNSTPIVLHRYDLSYVNRSTCVLHVPIGTKSLYQETDYWKDFANIVEDAGAPVVILPGSSVTITWSAVADAAGYTLILYTDEEQTQEYARYSFDSGGNLKSTMSSLSHTISGLTDGQHYYYTLSAQDAANDVITAFNGDFTMVVTSISESDADVNVQINYDSATGYLQVENPQAEIEKVQLYDLRGKKVIDTSQASFNIGYLPNGTYVVLVRTENGTTSQKIVK